MITKKARAPILEALLPEESATLLPSPIVFAGDQAQCELLIEPLQERFGWTFVASEVIPLNARFSALWNVQMQSEGNLDLQSWTEQESRRIHEFACGFIDGMRRAKNG